MIINKTETKYNVGDIVIFPWEDRTPELNQIVGIYVDFDSADQEKGLVIYKLVDTKRYREGGGTYYRDEDVHESSEDGILCDIKDAHKYADLIKKGFDEGGIGDGDLRKALGISDED